MTKKFDVEWVDNIPFLSEEEYIIIERDIEYISEKLEKASDLIFHTICLTDSYDGPIVMVDGKDGVDDTIFLTYYENTEWVTIQNEEE
jgi:hypothetical protein